MACLPRIVAIASVLALALPLANCADFSKFDPTDTLSNIFPDQKKPLPGDRKPLFPEGVPGVARGMPPDLVKGYQPPPEPTDDSQQQQQQQQQATPGKPKAKSKAKATAAAPGALTPPPEPQPN